MSAPASTAAAVEKKQLTATAVQPSDTQADDDDGFVCCSSCASHSHDRTPPSPARQVGKAASDAQPADCCASHSQANGSVHTPDTAAAPARQAATDARPADCCAEPCCASKADAAQSGGKSRNPVAWLIACGIPTLIAAALHIAYETSVQLPAVLSSAMTLTLPLLGTATVALVEIMTTVLALAGSIIGLAIIFPSVASAVRRRAIDINILMLIAVIGAWLLADFVEAAAVVLLFSIGEWLEEYAIKRNRSSIEKLMDLSPQTAQVLIGGEPRELPVEDVELSSTVIIRPGERIALDGIVTSGSASVDESPITGESVPVLKQPGDKVYAGALSVDGRLEFRTTATVQDSTLARIVALVEQSQAKRTPYERFINRFARYYTPLVVAIAAMVAVVPTLLSLLTPLELGGLDVWGYRALTLLVIGCPCALVIATPVSVVTGLSQAARMGMLVKGGAFLELGARVRAVAFDKTGTLTHGRPEVFLVEDMRGPGAPQAAAAPAPAPAAPSSAPAVSTPAPSGSVAPVVPPSAPAPASAQLLLYAAALEQHSTHPLARAVASALPEGAQLPLATGISETAGRGISGCLQDGSDGGQQIAIGSPGFAQGLVGIPAAIQQRIAELERGAATVLVLMLANRVIGLIGIRDQLRQDSPALLGRLRREHGIHTIMLTGDNTNVAESVARESGIDQVRAGLLPDQKMAEIELLKQRFGTVAMVGDGINDAPALALADVGIAMGAASSDTAVEVADVALMADNIAVLPAFFRLSRRVVGTIRANIVFALSVKALVMVLGIIGFVPLWLAIFADVGVLILVLLYSMRLGLPLYRK